MKGDFHVRFCERLAGKIPACLLDQNWGGKMIIRTSARPLTVSDNPNDVQLNPNFDKPLGCYLQTVDMRQDTEARLEK